MLRLWWAGPTVLAVAGGLAFAVGFAPHLADRVSLPRQVAIAPAAIPTHDARVTPGKTHVKSTHPRPHPTPVVTTTPPPAALSGGASNGGTVVQPARPVVTSSTREDDGGSSTDRLTASPTVRESSDR